MKLSSDLIHFWESYEGPCGLKDLYSRYVYVNAAYRRLQNLSDSYEIQGRYDGELPTETREFEAEFQKHDRLVLDTNEVHSSIEIHPFGKNKVLEAWIFHKRTFFHNDKLSGVFFWAEQARKLDVDIYTTFGTTASSIILNPSLYP